MRSLRFIFLLLVSAALLALPAANRTVHSVTQEIADQANRAATTDATWTAGSVDLEGVSTTDDTTYSFFAKQDPTGAGLATDSCKQPEFTEALAFGFDDKTNGFIPQGEPPKDCVDPIPGDFENDKVIFEEVDEVADGLGPVYNAQSCTNQEVHGLVINVPVLEAGGRLRVGRFGWKNQHASLVSFSGDAYLNEIGITNFLVRDENTSLGRFVGFGTPFDIVPDDTPCDDDPTVLCGEDVEQDVNVFAEFMRATQAPPRDADIIAKFQADVDAGEALFESMNGQYSCSVCHLPTILTGNRCQPINGGTFNIPDALARKRIHPFGDFLLHDIGTGDFIVQNGGPVTRTTVRTAPLWGVRTRPQLMHDGLSLTFNEAILRHSGEALQVRLRYQALSADDKRKLITFLESL